MIAIHMIALKENQSLLETELSVKNLDEFNYIVKQSRIKLLNYKIIRKNNLFSKKQLSPLELSNFANKVSLLLKSGLSLDKIMKIVKLSVKKKYFKKIIDNIESKLQLGIRFSEALESNQNIFPPLFIAMVKTADKVGNLSDVMDYLAKYYAKEHKLKQKLSTSLIYPTILCIVGILIFFLLITFVIPKFENILMSMNAEDIPLFTKFIFSFSNFIKNNIGFIAIVLFILFITCYFLLKKKKSHVKDYLKIKLPIMKKINTTLIVSQFARSMVILYKNGLSLFEAFKESSGLINNNYIKNKLKSAVQNLLKGNSLSKSLAKINFFPKLMIEMIEVGEQTNSLERILGNISDYYEDEANLTLKRFSQLIEPSIIISMAIIVCLVVMAIFIPMFNVMDGFIEV